MLRKTFLLLLLVLLLPVALCQAKTTESISGKIITGFRVLTVEPTNKSLHFTVYRGDYIKFRYPENAGALTFSVPALKYKNTVHPTPEKSPFFKMKTLGSYEFSLGSMTGTLKVIELVRPNYSEVTAQQAAGIINNLHPFILDVRTVKEHHEISIPGSYLIPIQDLQARIGELTSKRHEDIFVYCATGNRSTVAARILADMGFKRIYNLRYGVYDWARNGFPIEKGR